MADTLYCSFCGKNQHEVSKLIAGPKNVFICDECTALCAEICGQAKADTARRDFITTYVLEKAKHPVPPGYMERPNAHATNAAHMWDTIINPPKETTS